MHSIKLTLTMFVLLLYVAGSVCWLFWIGPELLMNGETADILVAFGGTCAWLLVSFGLGIHTIKKVRPTAGGGR